MAGGVGGGVAGSMLTRSYDQGGEVAQGGSVRLGFAPLVTGEGAYGVSLVGTGW